MLTLDIVLPAISDRDLKLLLSSKRKFPPGDMESRFRLLF